jgi:prepilin-type N-terminal cleavage/methylation domain-containing protein
MLITSCKNQKGFTLIEIAIVLIIIGLLIGGVLKGQSMIQNARVKRLVSDVDGLRAAALSYQDRYRMLPGDENDPNTPTGDANNGDNNGRFNEGTDWAMTDLRLALILPGSGAALPTHGFGGTLSFQYINIGGAGIRNSIIATNVPAEVCQEIDTKYDDGTWNAGDIRGSAAYTANTIILNFAWRY